MTKHPLPSPETLRQLLRYEPDTGKLFWRERRPEWFKSGYFSPATNAKRWNNRRAGKDAFTAFNNFGYPNGMILGRLYLAHRVIWAIVTGAWPKDKIDHIDHDRANNRFDNLREVSSKQNGRNLSRRRDNTSGITGVCRNNVLGKWQATIGNNGRLIHLGYFDDISDAVFARAKADIKYGYHGNHGK